MPSRVWWRTNTPHDKLYDWEEITKEGNCWLGNVDRINCYHCWCYFRIATLNIRKKVSFHLLSRLDFFLREAVTYSVFFEDFFLVPTGHPKWETERSVFYDLQSVLDNKAKEPSILKNVRSMSNESKHVLVHSSIEYIDFSFISRTSRYHYETAMQVPLELKTWSISFP